MNIRKSVISAILVLLFGQCCANSDSIPVKVADLTTFGGRKCYQTDLAYLIDKFLALDVGSGFHVAHVTANVIGRYFEDFSLSDHIDNIMILTPDRYNSTCFSFGHCRALIIIVNHVLTSGTSKCYDVLHGHCYHAQGLKVITDFEIENIVPFRLTCNSQNKNLLLDQKRMHLSLTDIWSPVEDIANSAVEQIKDIGSQFTNELNAQINQLQKILGSQIDQVSLVVQESSEAVLHEVTTGAQAIGQKLDDIEEIVEHDVSSVAYYAHIIV